MKLVIVSTFRNKEKEDEAINVCNAALVIKVFVVIRVTVYMAQFFHFDELKEQYIM